MTDPDSVDRDWLVKDLEPMPNITFSPPPPPPGLPPLPDYGPVRNENPKALAGRRKIEHHHTPRLPALYQAAIHELGARKYGSFNWRDKPIKLTDYIDAMRRHLDEIESGVDIDSESGLPHCAHLMATAAIVIDAGEHGTLIDDRRPTPSFVPEMKRIAEIKKGWPDAA